MPELKIATAKLIPVTSAAMRLLQWLRPGDLSLRLAEIVRVLQPLAQALHDERERLLNACALWEGEGASRRRIDTEIKDAAGMVIAVQTELVDPVDFNARDAALLSGERTITVPAHLFRTDFADISKEFIHDTSKLLPPDYLALLELMSAPAPATPS